MSKRNIERHGIKTSLTNRFPGRPFGGMDGVILAQEIDKYFGKEVSELNYAECAGLRYALYDEAVLFLEGDGSQIHHWKRSALTAY